MDRSFLSDKAIIEASRDFICIRTATYEDKSEASFLKDTFVERAGGTLRNFGFCILAPDGKKALRKSSRGPNFVYKDSSEMAADLRKIAGEYSSKSSTRKSTSPIPQMKSVRLGLNVASCDGLPAIVILGRSQNHVDFLSRKLGDVIWDKDVAGKYICSSTTNYSDLKSVSGTKPRSGYLLIKPDAYGLEGTLIKAIPANASPASLKNSLLKAADSYQRLSKSHGTHVQNGRRKGESWETEVPVPERTRSLDRETPGRGSRRK